MINPKYTQKLDEIFQVDEGFMDDYLPNPAEWIRKGMKEILGDTIMSGFDVLKSEGVSWFILKSLWWVFRHYWLELSILAGTVSLITWLSFKVKRWWDGSSSIISKLEEQKKESEQRLKMIERKIDEQIKTAKLDQEEEQRIRQTLMKMMSDMKQKNEEKISLQVKELDSVPEDQNAVMRTVKKTLDVGNRERDRFQQKMELRLSQHLNELP